MIHKLFSGVGLAIAGVVGLVTLRAAMPAISPQPTDLGLVDGKFTATESESDNWVSSQTDYVARFTPPITYTSDVAQAREKLLKILMAHPNSEIITHQPRYIHLESRSNLLNFVDDTEFYFDEANRLIHVRAGARLGRSDLGANRARIQQIRQAFEK